MSAKKTIERDPSAEADEVVENLAKVALANMLDFARFHDDGRLEIFDHGKAREVGAKISVVPKKGEPGRKGRKIRQTTITMPDKYTALVRLGEHLGVFPVSRKRK